MFVSTEHKLHDWHWRTYGQADDKMEVGHLLHHAKTSAAIYVNSKSL